MGAKQFLREPNAQYQQWDQLLWWLIYHWEIGTWRIWVSLGWIIPGDWLIPPTMNQDGLHRIYGKESHKHWIFECYRLHPCHDHWKNAWRSCLGIGFCTDDKACHIFNKALISLQISIFLCSQLLTGFVWIFPQVNIYIPGRIQLFKHLI